MSKDFNNDWLRRYEARARISVQDSQQCQCPEELEGDCGREASGAGCPVVLFVLYRVRLLDVDAKYASVKDLLDGLQYAGLIPGDKEGQILLKVWQKKVSSYPEELTIIEIVTPDEKDSPTGE